MLEPYIIQATLDDLSVYNYNHHHDHDRSDNNNINFIHDHDPDPDHGKGHSYPVYILSGIHSLIRHSLESHALSDNINSCAATNPHSTHSFVKTGETALSLHYNPAQTDCGLPSRESRPTPSHTRQRSLTESVQAEIDHEMATFVTEAPGSPPGLTGSKSSKSSSFHSSSLSGTDGILSDITHFEEIGLEEAQPRSPISPRRSIHGPEKPLRPMLHMSATTTTGGPRGNAAVLTAMRDLTNIPSRLTPGGQLSPGKAHVPTHSLCLPNEGVMRKPYRNASTPSLAIRAMSNRNHSRSPSPGSTSTTSKQSITPKPSPRLVPVPFSPKQAPIRRGSWQPSRKSVKELEAEYNDEDDDLPEDASLWNVPLSPRPPSERSPKIGPVSPKCSPRVSPERPSPLRASISAPLTDLSPNVTAGTYSAESAISPNLSSPLSPRWKPKTTRVASTGTLPDHFGYQPSRSKSWSAVLSELSEEAKALTESLENHALVTERKQEDAVQNGREIRRNGTEKLSRSKTSTIELPPLRRNNVMIDPLPISKEKEKVLTRTRPSWLPPKSQKEEKKHLKEYQRMMELSQEAERKKAAQVADLQCAKDDTKKTLLRIWEEHVLPNWDQVIREPRTRELWWRGVAPKSRAQVWPKVVGNELSLTEMSYSKALQRAKEIEKQIATGSEIEQHRKEKLWFDAIQRDVKVALPDLKIFQPGGPLHDSLIDVLMAYSMYRSDVGYSHGTHVRFSLWFQKLLGLN